MLVFLAYLGFSLLDPWGYSAPYLQAILCICLLALMGINFFTAYKNRQGQPRKTKKVFYILLMTIVVLVGVNYQAEDDVERRVDIALKPPFFFERPIPVIEVSFTPPAYSGYKKQSGVFPFFTDDKGVKRRQKSINPIADGSKIFVRVTNVKYAPTLQLGIYEKPFTKASDGSFEVSAVVGKIINWKIRQGSKTLGSWPVVLIDDHVPEIKLFAVLKEKIKNYSHFKINISDDYKIDQSYLMLTKNAESIENEISDQKDSPEKWPLDIAGLREFEDGIHIDLSGSKFAGQLVDITLNVKDEKGQIQTATVDQQRIAPKVFTEKTAQRLNVIRQDLIKDPGAHLRLASEVKALGMSPSLVGELSEKSAVYHMALRSIYWRMKGEGSFFRPRKAKNIDLDSAEKMLLDVAYLMEEGSAYSKKGYLLEALDSARLDLHNRKKATDIRTNLMKLHQKFITYYGANRKHAKGFYPKVNNLKFIFNGILKYAHEGKYRDAIKINEFLKIGFLRGDYIFLERHSYGQLIALIEGRNILKNLIALQDTLISHSKQALLEEEKYAQNKINIASRDQTIGYPEYLKDIGEWLNVQNKVSSSLLSLKATLIKAEPEFKGLFEGVPLMITDIKKQLNMNNQGSLGAEKINNAIMAQKKLIHSLKAIKAIIDKKIEE